MGPGLLPLPVGEEGGLNGVKAWMHMIYWPSV